MDSANEMDPVLRSLGAELERDDPALAAMLSGRRLHRHSAAWVLLGLPLLVPALLVPALLVPARVMLAVLAMLLILSSPVLACWLCSLTDGPVTPRTE